MAESGAFGHSRRISDSAITAVQDHALYQQLLGITAPWRARSVEVNRKEGEILIHLDTDETSIPLCPTCGAPAPVHDHRERRWRHLDTVQFRTILIARVPRVSCPLHGIHGISVPWAEQNARFTALCEALVIDWSLESSLSAVARMLKLTWDQVSGIQDRAVERGLARRERQKPVRIGVDETSFQKHHEYVTVVCDVDAPKGTGVLFVADDRKEASLAPFFEQTGAWGRHGIEHVAMDMHQPFINATRAALADADSRIVFDKFHVAKHLGDAVNDVRIAEHRALRAKGDHRLTGTKYAFLRNTDALTSHARQTLAALKDSGLKVARAWAIKEMAMDLWRYTSRAWAEKAWTRRYGWAIRSRLEPIMRVARMIKAHWDGVMNAVTSDTTNARSESLNSCIQWIKRKACGFRNRDRFRTAIYFHLGRLDLYPESLKFAHTNS